MCVCRIPCGIVPHQLLEYNVETGQTMWGAKRWKIFYILTFEISRSDQVESLLFRVSTLSYGAHIPTFGTSPHQYRFRDIHSVGGYNLTCYFAMSISEEENHA